MEIIINGELNEDYYNQLKKRVKQQVKEIKVKYNLFDIDSINKQDLFRCNYEINNYQYRIKKLVLKINSYGSPTLDNKYVIDYFELVLNDYIKLLIDVLIRKEVLLFSLSKGA